MLARLARQDIGAPHSVEDRGNLHQHITGVAVGLLLIAGELRTEMADQPRRDAGGQRQVHAFSGDVFLAVIADGIVGDRTGRIEEHIIRSPIAGGVHTQRELVARVKVDIELGVGRISDLCRRIFSCQGRKLGSSGKDQGLVGSFVIAAAVRSCGGPWQDPRTAIQKFDDIRHVKDVLIESRKEKDLVALQRSADGASDLLLAIVRFEGEIGKGGAKRAVAEIVEHRTMQMV